MVIYKLWAKTANSYECEIRGLCKSGEQYLVGNLYAPWRNANPGGLYRCDTVESGSLTEPECIECLCVSSEIMWEQSHG